MKKVVIHNLLTFNEVALLYPRKEVAGSSSSYTSDDLESAIEKMAFELEITYATQQDIFQSSPKPLEMSNFTMYDSYDDYYSIAWDRPRREIKRPWRYSYDDLIDYALIVKEETDEDRESQS